MEKAPPVVALPTFETVADKVVETNSVATVGEEAPAVRSARGTELTVTFLQLLQLFPSFDSEITPPPAEEVLSAQARTEYVPVEGNVYDFVVLELPPEARVDIEVEPRSVTVPPPLAAVATWKKFEKDEPVEAFPIFEIVEDRVTATPTVALVGVLLPAVKSGVGSGGLATKVAATLQLEPMDPVVNVLPPVIDPAQPETEFIEYPEFGVTVRVVVLPEVTVCDAGEIEPPEPALPVTVYVVS